MTREWVFSVMADQLEEMGEEELSRFFRGVETEPEGYMAQMMEHIGRGMGLTWQEGKESWFKAAANFADHELEHQGLIVEDLPGIVERAVEANEDVLQDDIVEIDQHPRVILHAGRYPYGPARLLVSGWFAVNINNQGEVQPNPLDYDEDDEEYEFELDPPPRWGELEHPQQMRLLQTVTGFDEDSIKIDKGQIWGRPYRNYAYSGMKVCWGPLADALAEAVRIGYIAEG